MDNTLIFFLIKEKKKEMKRYTKVNNIFFFGRKPEMELFRTARAFSEREYYSAVVKFLIYALLRSY